MSFTSSMQLEDQLTVKSWVVLLGNNIVLAFLEYQFGHAFKVVQELRAHAENGLLTELEQSPLENFTAPVLRSVLSITGIHAACFLYQNTDIRLQQEQQAGNNKVPSSAFLLESMEVMLAQDLVKFCPKSPVGYWWLGYVERESVAKSKWNNLKGVALCLKHMTDCYEAADAQDDDFFKALGRIEAAFCHALGGGGMVGYEVNIEKVRVRRDFGSDRLPTSEVDGLWSTDQSLSKAYPSQRKPNRHSGNASGRRNVVALSLGGLAIVERGHGVLR